MDNNKKPLEPGLNVTIHYSMPEFPAHVPDELEKYKKDNEINFTERKD